jgi:phosphatidylserine/phosphatidylglycerophosphate/cardiolipin synthase-like enzyme
VGPDRARAQITALLEQARFSIRIIDPKLSDPAIRAVLDAKATEGVAVEVLGDRRVHGQISHGKLLIVDDKIATIGSLALSASNLDARREMAIVVRESNVVRQLLEFFQEAALYEPAGRPTAWRAEYAA